MLTQKQWQDVSNYSKSKLISLFDPTIIFAEKKDLRTSMQMEYKGLYIYVEDSDGKKLSNKGFLQETADNVLNGIDTVIQNIFADLQSNNIPASKVKSGTCYFDLITSVDYMSDPLQWDEKKDGVYFMWGQEYFSIFLSHQIQKMGLSKIGILDRLCVSARLPSNLWKYPEGLCYKLVCSSYSS